VEVIDPAKRDDRLLALLQKHHSSRKNRIIIFVLYKKEAPRVEGLLKRKGWNATAIHGDISQAQRTAAVEAFKAGTIPLLIATDVAARGLDIPDVEARGRGGGLGVMGAGRTRLRGCAERPRRLGGAARRAPASPLAALSHPAPTPTSHPTPHRSTPPPPPGGHQLLLPADH
jgi:hypothetical protein